MVAEKITVRIKRSNIAEGVEPYEAAFTVPFKEGITVQGVLRYIYKNIDSTLAFRDYNCFLGVCSACVVRVNGKTVRACKTSLVKDANILIEPPKGKVIRDLVSDFSKKD